MNITNNLQNMIADMGAIDIQNTSIIDKFSQLLDIIAEKQIKEFEENSHIEPSLHLSKPAALLHMNHSLNILNSSDFLLSLNLTEQQLKSQIEKTKFISKVMIMCLEVNIKVMMYRKIELKNLIIEFTVQKGEIFQDEYRFANIHFPILDYKIPINDYYGISRTTWKLNPFASIEESEKLVTNMNLLQIISLSTFEEIKLANLENYIEINFDLSEKYISESKEYSCIYYNKSKSIFSDHNLISSKNYDSGTKVSCATGHLSWFGVIFEPLGEMIFTENITLLLYNMKALGNYDFWESESTNKLLYKYLVFWLTYCVTAVTCIFMLIFKTDKGVRWIELGVREEISKLIEI